MRLLALRVSQFRRFGDPVAIEGIGEGVNVLAGPNEMGKSTLFHALEAAFLIRHRASGSSLELMRPRSGGEPMVEVDFIAQGRTWRLRKQFGKGAAAVLTDLASGHIEARAGDAEDKVLDLTGRKDELHGPLGLVWVRQQHTLSDAGPDIDFETGKPKVRGERQALLDVIGNEVENAAGGDAFNAVQRRVDIALETYVTRARGTAKKSGPYDTAIRTRDALKSALAEAELAAEASRQRLVRIATLSADVAQRSAQSQRSTAETSVAALEIRLSDAVALRAKRDLAHQAMRTAEAEALAARQACTSEAEARQRRLDLAQRQEASAALEAEIAALAAKLNTDPATPARLEQASRLDHDMALATAAVQSEAAIVDIALEPGHDNRVRSAGETVNQDQRFSVSESLMIDIAGIARIAISPGSTRAKAAEAKRAKAEAELQSLLASLNAATLDDAKVKAAARAATVEALDRARAKLSGLAPTGSAGIAAELAKLDAAVSNVERAADLETKRMAAEETLTAARGTFERTQQQALSDAAFRDLSADLQREKDETARRLEEFRRLSLTLENLKGEQAGADEDGRAGRVDALKGELQRADVEVKRLEAEVAALNLLSGTLARIEERARSTYFEPVSRKLTPHLTTLFGASTASFREQFSPEALTRNGAAETVASLSDGTREQLSVLVRLSFAELLAERGDGPPLVLDDPLVYSDDARLESMCRILAAAGRNMQILLLTCRAHAFENLPGRRLSVTPWRPG